MEGPGGYMEGPRGYMEGPRKLFVGRAEYGPVPAGRCMPGTGLVYEVSDWYRCLNGTGSLNIG